MRKIEPSIQGFPAISGKITKVAIVKKRARVSHMFRARTWLYGKVYSDCLFDTDTEARKFIKQEQKDMKK